MMGDEHEERAMKDRKKETTMKRKLFVISLTAFVQFISLLRKLFAKVGFFNGRKVANLQEI